MTIRVLFFGATAAITGKRQVVIDLDDKSRAKTIFEQMVAEYPCLAAHRLFFSVNQQYATGDEIVCDGDELAVFAAVSGG